MHLIKAIFVLLFSLEEDAFRTPRRILLPPIPSKFVAVPNFIRNPYCKSANFLIFPRDDRPYFSNPVSPSSSQFIIHSPDSPWNFLTFHFARILHIIPCFIFSCFHLPSFCSFTFSTNFSFPILSLILTWHLGHFHKNDLISSK